MLRHNLELSKGVLWVLLASPLPGSSMCHLDMGPVCSLGSKVLNRTYRGHPPFPEQACSKLA